MKIIDVRSRTALLASILIMAEGLLPVVAWAAPINYNFTVVADDALGTYSGTFSYDSSSIVPSGTNSATGLFTTLDFTFGGITYNASSANTGFLSFDPTGGLTGFWFGTNCMARSCFEPPGASWQVHANSEPEFAYGTSTPPYGGDGSLSFSRAPMSVSEPGVWGMFGFDSCCSAAG